MAVKAKGLQTSTTGIVRNEKLPARSKVEKMEDLPSIGQSATRVSPRRCFTNHPLFSAAPAGSSRLSQPVFSAGLRFIICRRISIERNRLSKTRVSSIEVDTKSASVALL
ncbi:hypothetical protein PoB_004957700 [Plakobranchus ocellatus]|uniref:Uncharacterized protein n=1 Tax=Plakobranchus ocellatus TaxID=259542 RepID=A0AAV4BVI4_9GAST|nr:hypothetical protein PoB_004957700 [Plakobranchus ocellatus]